MAKKKAKKKVTKKKAKKKRSTTKMVIKKKPSDGDVYGKRPVHYLVDEIAGLLEVPTHCRIACEKVAELRNDHPDLMRWGVDKLRCPSSARLGLQEGASWPPPEEILMLFRYGLVVAVHDFTQESREKRLHFDKNQKGGAVATDFDLAAHLAAECADNKTAFRDSVYEALESVRSDLAPPKSGGEDKGAGNEELKEMVAGLSQQVGELLEAKQLPENLKSSELNRVPWDPKAEGYISNTEAIASAKTFGIDHDIDDLKELDPDKLKKLLRSRNCNVTFMSTKKPQPRGRVHEGGWDAYLKRRVDEKNRFEAAVESGINDIKS